MNVVITGCTGFVGREIVAHLAAAGAHLLLIGRDPTKIEKLFPGVPVATYEQLPERGHNFDVLIHLAVLNNDTSASLDDFREVNVALMMKTVIAARAAGIRKFVYFSTFHAVDNSNVSPYAVSKREAVAKLKTAQIDSITLFLPTVYGRRWGGKLVSLNWIPIWISKLAFVPIAALKPVVNAKRISDFLLSAPAEPEREHVYLCDDKDDNLIYFASRRMIDITFAMIVILVLWWLFAIIWVCVRAQSSGPGIFVQTRVGRFGASFQCYKFRTMAEGTKQVGTHELTASAVTTVGRFLRGTKLDELPQVWNILRNEMSLVGPRPCLPSQTELVAFRKAANLFALKPGITGYAQIHDVDMSNPARLTLYETQYMALRSILLDLQILLATFRGRGQGDRTTT